MSRARRTLAQPWLYLDDAEYDLTEWTKKADKVYADGQEDDLVALLGELRSMLSKVQDDLGRARQDASEAAKEHLPDGTVDHYLPHAVAFNQKLVERISHHLGNFPTEINDMVSVLGEDEIVAHDEEGLELEHIIPRLEKYFPQREGVEEVTQELERITRGTDPRNIPEPDDDVERSKWEVLRVQSDKLHALYKAISFCSSPDNIVELRELKAAEGSKGRAGYGIIWGGVAFRAEGGQDRLWIVHSEQQCPEE